MVAGWGEITTETVQEMRGKGRKIGQSRLGMKTAACLGGYRRGVLWSS